MATEASRSSDGGSAADSYIGSFISLTSKSDIRYEGLLFNVNTNEASIGLRNVRSFGTEGRRKDGPQVPVSDKVYEFIVFRGSDIKDLQVKSSPPVQTAPSVDNDPAIIQSRYTPPTAPSRLPAIPETTTQTSGSSDFRTQIRQSGIPRTTDQTAPLHHPGENWASWNPSPPHIINSSGLPGPMNWSGYYGHSTSVQPPVQYPNTNSSFQTGASTLPVLHSVGFPPPPLLPISSTGSLSSTLLPSQSPALTFDSSSMMPSVTPPQALPVVSQSTNTSLDLSTVPTLVPNPSQPIFISPTSFNSFSEPLASVDVTSSSPALVTPGQFFQPGPTVSQTAHMAQKDVEVVRVPSFGSLPQPQARMPVKPVPVSTEIQAPLLPLPAPINQKMNGASPHTRYVNPGRHERARRNEFSSSVPNYTEEFDFEAMNEKFKKDEVWGHLGKSISKTDVGPPLLDQDDADVPATDKKPIYKKNDFFDTLFCNSLDHGSRNRRPRFSEQMKVDTETFGDFSKNSGFQGGRGPGRGGWYRGGYHGRGYGNDGRGRGRGQGQGQNGYRAM